MAERIRLETGKFHLTGYTGTDNLCVTGYTASGGYAGAEGQKERPEGKEGADMHPILSKEFIRAFEHHTQERVGKPRVPRAASRKRWFRRTR